MSDRFAASIRRHHQAVMSNVMGRLQQGQVFALTPQEFVALSDLSGALNYWAAQTPEYPVDIQPEIAFGDFSRKTFTASREVVTAFPFRVPAHGLLYGSTAEFGGDPWLRILTIARVAGDVSPSALVYSRGKQATCYLTAGVEAQPGELLYFNTVIDEDAALGTTGSGFSIVWPAP